MGFAQLARVLVREIGKGNSYRKILTQKMNDKHFIKVFDQSGNTLVNRVKTFAKSVVGDKKVITRKEVALFDNLDGSNTGYKANFDRVYNSAGELAGLLREHTGARTVIHRIASETPSFELD